MTDLMLKSMMVKKSWQGNRRMIADFRCARAFSNEIDRFDLVCPGEFQDFGMGEAITKVLGSWLVGYDSVVTLIDGAMSTQVGGMYSNM